MMRLSQCCTTMLSFEEFTGWVEIDGKEAKEYGIKHSRNDEGVPIITCWIASEVGKVQVCHEISSLMEFHSDS